MALLFGLGLPVAPHPGYDPVAFARRAEELEFDFLSVSDHPASTTPTYEAWTMLSFLAAATTRIRIATRVLGVPYRPPGVLAKMAETFDRLSDGRLILGLGGGYSDAEFCALGLPVPTASEKVTGLADAIEICRGLWTQPAFTHPGRIFRTVEASVVPLPDHRIPIWLGTFGDRALAITGRLADGWIPSLGSASPQRAAEMRAKMLAAAEAAGRDPGEITCAYHFEIDLAPRTAADVPWVVSGSVAAIVEQLTGFTALGFNALSIVPGGPDRVETIERLASEVLPAVRSLSA